MIKGLIGRITRGDASSGYRPELDGLRVLAILPVLVSHIAERILRVAASADPDPGAQAFFSHIVPRGFAGVHFFLVISGFVIALPYVRAALAGRPAPSAFAFLRRRFLRLAPPYALVLIGIFAFLELTGYRPQATGNFERAAIGLEASLGASLLFVHGLLFETFPRLNPPGWSLEVEIHYYLLFALVGAGVAGLALRRGRLAVLIGAALAVAVLTEMAIGGDRATFVVLRYVPLFLLGVWAAHFVLSRPPADAREERRWDLAALGAVLAYAVLSLWINRSLLFNGPYEIAAYAAFLVLVIACFRAGRFRKLLAAAPLALIGSLTYSIYLTHMPLVQFLVTPAYGLLSALLGPMPLGLALLLLVPLLAAIVIAAAIPFHILVERPCMAWAAGQGLRAPWGSPVSARARVDLK